MRSPRGGLGSAFDTLELSGAGFKIGPAIIWLGMEKREREREIVEEIESHALEIFP